MTMATLGEDMAEEDAGAGVVEGRGSGVAEEGAGAGVVEGRGSGAAEGTGGSTFVFAVAAIDLGCGWSSERRLDCFLELQHIPKRTRA